MVLGCFQVFKAVANTMGWMKGGIFILKRLKAWKGVRVFRVF